MNFIVVHPCQNTIRFKHSTFSYPPRHSNVHDILTQILNECMHYLDFDVLSQEPAFCHCNGKHYPLPNYMDPVFRIEHPILPPAPLVPSTSSSGACNTPARSDEISHTVDLFLEDVDLEDEKSALDESQISLIEPYFVDVVTLTPRPNNTQDIGTQACESSVSNDDDPLPPVHQGIVIDNRHDLPTFPQSFRDKPLPEMYQRLRLL